MKQCMINKYAVESSWCIKNEPLHKHRRKQVSNIWQPYFIQVEYISRIGYRIDFINDPIHIFFNKLNCHLGI